MLRGLRRGRFAACCGHCQVTREPLRRPSCEYSAALAEMFPANCSDIAWTLPCSCSAIAGMLRWTLRGYSTSNSPVLRRTFHRPLRCCCAGSSAAVGRTLPGNCPDIARMLLGKLPGNFTGNCTTLSPDMTADVSPDTARMWRDLLPQL